MKIDQGQKMFAGSVASALVRAWTERLGLRVVVDPRGGTSSAELTDDTGRVVWSQKAEGIQLELPLAPAAPRPRIADLRVPDPPGGEAPAPGACRECGGAGAHKMNCSRRGLPDGAPFVGDRITPAAERKKAKRERSSPKASAPKKAASKGKRKRP